MRYLCKSSTKKDNIPFLGVEYLNVFWIASPIQRINPISSTILAGSRDSNSLVKGFWTFQILWKKIRAGKYARNPLIVFVIFFKAFNIMNKVPGADPTIF